MEQGRVVIIGARGPVRDAVRAALKEGGWTITAVERGDDPLSCVIGATAVVLLEGLSGDPAIYRTALRALAETLPQATTVTRVVALAPVHPRARQRAEAQERFQAAEDDARTAGLPLVVLRYGLLVGTTRYRGPADSALFAKQLCLLPTAERGEQRVRPLLVDDLGRLIVRALAVDSPPTELAVEGPETDRLDELLRYFGARRVWRYSARQPLVVVALSLAALALPFAAGYAFGFDATATFALASVVAAVVYSVGFGLGARLFAVQRLLPDSELLLQPAARPELLDVSLRTVADEWGERPAEKRARIREQQRSLRRYRAQAASPLIALFLAGLGGAAAVVGGHDALFATALGVRLTGGAMAVAGAFCAFGGVSLFFVRWAGRYVVAFLGGLFGTAVLLVLLAVALANQDPPIAVAVILYLLAPAIGCCFALARRGWTVVSRFLKANWGKALSAIAAGGALLGLAQVVFTSVYLPTAGTPTVSMTASLEPAGLVNGRMALNAVVTLKNPTENAVNLVGTYYTVRTTALAAATPVPRSAEIPSAATSAMEDILYRGRPVRGWAIERHPVVAERGAITAPNWFLEPGEKIERRFVVLVPRRANLATLFASVSLARRRFETSTPSRVAIQKVNAARVIFQFARIEDPSWIHWLTRSPRYIHGVGAFDASAVGDCPPEHILMTWIDGNKDTDVYTPCTTATTNLAARFTDYYGLTEADTSAQVAVDPREVDAKSAKPPR